MSRRASGFPLAAVAQLFGTLALVVASLLTPVRQVTGGAILWGALSGVGSGLGVAFLYRGFGRGQISVVAPLSAVGAAALPVLVGVALGEWPSLLATFGIIAGIPAIWLVSRGDSGGDHDGGEALQRSPSASTGVLDGLIAGAGFALLFIALDRVPAAAGLWPATLGSAVSVVAIAALAVGAGAGLRLPISAVGGAVIVGVLGSAATALYMFSTRGQLLAVVAVLTSLYPALTIVLAWLVLRERIGRGQLAGLGFAVAAVALIALG